MSTRPEPDPRIAAYIAEIEQPGIPYVSTSHVTLYNLYREHGEKTINYLLDQYFGRCVVSYLKGEK